MSLCSTSFPHCCLFHHIVNLEHYNVLPTPVPWLCIMMWEDPSSHALYHGLQIVIPSCLVSHGIIIPLLPCIIMYCVFPSPCALHHELHIIIPSCPVSHSIIIPPHYNILHTSYLVSCGIIISAHYNVLPTSLPTCIISWTSHCNS